jgi:hypothetical protein
LWYDWSYELSPVQWAIAALIVLGLGWSVYGVFFNRELYCKVALFGGGITQVPAFSLLEKIDAMKSQ